jgi:Ricin-type beta-trefoil lectin domain-like
MNRTFYVAGSLIAVALFAEPAPAAQPAFFYNSHTNMCLQPADGSKVQGAAIVQEPCQGGNVAQEWVYVQVSGAFHFQNALSGLCLDARGKATNGTPVQQWTCDQISNENWEPPTNSKGASIGPVISRVSGSSGDCLDVPGGQQKIGLPMQVYHCNGTVSQLWDLKPGAPVVPGVLGLNSDAAMAQVTLYDLTPVVTSGNGCPVVVAQSPAPFSQQVPQAQVTLTVGNDTNCPPK